MTLATLYNLPSQLDWLNTLDPDNRLLRGRAYQIVKRILDLGLVTTAIILLSPVLLMCAIAIKIESPNGPAMFAQTRTGKGGRSFKMYKFRTMVAEAEELKKQLSHLNELQWPDFKITNDPRITRVGRFLRKTSLDELPQLLNILLGDMSIVGPRPTSFSASTYQLWHTERLDVMPGLTGLWQIVGRASTEFDERLRLDIAYIERRCITLDFEIMFRTITAVVQQRGAA